MLKIFVCLNLHKIHCHNEPACEILVLIPYVSSEGSDEPVQMLSLAKVFTACTHKVGIKIMAPAKFHAFSPTR